MALKSLFGKILVVVTDIYSKFGFIIDLLAKQDITKLNDADRVAFGIAAAEWKQLGATCNEVGLTLDRVKEGGITPEEYVELFQKLRAVAEEAADIGPATRDLLK